MASPSPSPSPSLGSSPASSLGSSPPGSAPRCRVCPKRLNLLALSVGKCRCGGIFCAAHKDVAAHQCSYDYKKDQRAALEDRLGAEAAAGIADKIARI